MLSSLASLRIVPREALILHEDHDPSRLAALQSRMKAEGVQRNPVIAAPCEGRYLVLDGAHRVHALEEMESRLALIQVVEPPPAAESWGHLIANGDFSSALRSGEGVEVVPGEPDGEWVAAVETAGEQLTLRAGEDGLLGQVRAMWEIQSGYPKDGPVRRVDPDSPLRLSRGEAVIRYRSFTPSELTEVVGAGMVLPAGITRFHIRERVLGVRFPLEKLMNGEAEARDGELRSLVKEFWEADRIRYYEEPVILFE